jgi:type I restriction-modification system DNA methylase subunit
MPRRKIVKALNGMSGRYSTYEIFGDWVRCMALSISNMVTLIHGPVWQAREKEYMDTISKYTQEEQQLFCQMFAWLVETLEGEPDDVLGTIYMEANMGSKATAQVFTPFSLSTMCARLAIDATKLPEEGKITLNEPSCGGGGMIIAVARVLQQRGINYQRRLEVVAQDLDWRCVYMCYVQLSLLGIRALVVQGDTLEHPYHPLETQRSHILVTPARMGVLF